MFIAPPVAFIANSTLSMYGYDEVFTDLSVNFLVFWAANGPIG